MGYTTVSVDSGTGIAVYGDSVSGQIIQGIKTIDPTSDSSSPIGNSANPWYVRSAKTTSTSQSVTSVTTSSTPILASNTNRKGAFLKNLSDTTLYISLASTAVIATSAPLYPGEVYNCPEWYAGAISAIHNGSGSKDLYSCEG